MHDYFIYLKDVAILMNLTGLAFIGLALLDATRKKYKLDEEITRVAAYVLGMVYLLAAGLMAYMLYWGV